MSRHCQSEQPVFSRIGRLAAATKLRELCLLLLFCLVVPTVSVAERDRAKEVTVGVHVNQILDINFTEDHFIIDFWVWFFWAPDAPGEFALGDYSPIANFEVIDGQILEIRGVERREEDGFTYENARVITKITNRFDMKSYPVDSHEITIRIEDKNHRIEKLIYKADKAGTSTSPNVVIPGWEITPHGPVIEINQYRTNFGNIDLPPDFVSQYTQFQYAHYLQKPLFLSTVKSLWPTFMATFVALAALFLSPRSDSRFALCVGALFAIVANKVSITSGVQDAVQFGFADIVQLVSGGIVLFAILESVLVCRMWDAGRSCNGLFRRFDAFLPPALFMSYLLIVGGLVVAYK